MDSLTVVSREAPAEQGPSQDPAAAELTTGHDGERRRRSESGARQLCPTLVLALSSRCALSIENENG